MAEANSNSTVSIEKIDDHKPEFMQEDSHPTSSQAQPEEVERKAKIDSMWQQMNKGVSSKTLKSILEPKNSKLNKSPQKSLQKSSTGWMTYLGLGTKKTSSPGQCLPKKQANTDQKGVPEDAKKLAAAALSAVRDSALLNAAGKGKVEVMEVRNFAGEDIEVKKLVDAEEAAEKARNATGAASSGVDAVLEQIKKKPKLSVLDKTRKDWGEFKEENRGMEEELDAYKKSSNQYSDKVSFLQRTDYREFERERDARLALQAKRKTDMREDDL